MRSHGNPDNRTQNTALYGCTIAVGLILSYIEFLIPFYFGIPGIKLGLANLCVVILIYIRGYKSAFLVNLLRIILAGFMFGSMSSIVYSVSGAALSYILMLFIHRIGIMSPIGVSITGGVFHNIGQVLIASFVVSDFRIAVYLPVLILAGALTGFIIGIIANMVIPKLNHILTDIS